MKLELNKEYNISDLKLEELPPGTIVRTIEYETDNQYKYDKDILVIVTRQHSDSAKVDDRPLVAVDVNTGMTYTDEHCMIKYEILKIK